MRELLSLGEDLLIWLCVEVLGENSVRKIILSEETFQGDTVKQSLLVEKKHIGSGLGFLNFCLRFLVCFY